MPDKKELRRITVEEFLNRVTAGGVGDIYIDVEDLGKGKYVIPQSVASDLLHSDADGTFSKGHSGVTDTYYVHQRGGTSAGNEPATNADATQGPSGSEYWLVNAVVAAFKVDATVADRTCVVRYLPLSPFATPTTITVGATTGGLTLSASQEGIIVMQGNNITFLNDNGAVTNEATGFLPALLYPGDAILAGITANKQTADRSAIRLNYRRLA